MTFPIPFVYFQYDQLYACCKRQKLAHRLKYPLKLGYYRLNKHARVTSSLDRKISELPSSRASVLSLLDNSRSPTYNNIIVASHIYLTRLQLCNNFPLPFPDFLQIPPTPHLQASLFQYPKQSPHVHVGGFGAEGGVAVTAEDTLCAVFQAHTPEYLKNSPTATGIDSLRVEEG